MPIDYTSLNVHPDTLERIKQLQDELGGVESRETEDGVVRHLLKETYGYGDVHDDE